MMRPVNHASLLIPLILSVKLKLVTLSQSINSWRQVNIMRYQDGLGRSHPENEFLMTGTGIVITQDSVHFPGTPDLNIA